MATSIEVASSGSVGKQVFASDKPVILKGWINPTGVSGGTIVIRDGNASGEVKITAVSLVALGMVNEIPCEGIRFDKGMHVKVTNDDIAPAYLFIS